MFFKRKEHFSSVMYFSPVQKNLIMAAYLWQFSADGKVKYIPLNQISLNQFMHTCCSLLTWSSMPLSLPTKSRKCCLTVIDHSQFLCHVLNPWSQDADEFLSASFWFWGVFWLIAYFNSGWCYLQTKENLSWKD